jgi:glycerol-3-phosphate acyltransferase PlsX
MKTPASITLALDAHGGDYGPDVMFPAALDALERDPGLSILLVGRPADLQSLVTEVAHPRLGLAPADTVLDGNERPVTVLRKGSDSSLGRAIELLARGEAQACVSAGSTVALMALAVRRLGLLPGIRRPALMSAVPSKSGSTSLLDLGANLRVDADQLVQFALMGAVAHNGSNAPPRVGLLNVGHEESKGHAVVQEAHERLRQMSLNYVGFVEGHDIFAGRVEVAVCDGFAGNLLLKSSEGLARMLFGELRSALESGPRARLAGWLARPRLAQMLERFDPGKHNGAPLLGLQGVVVKSHGGADRQATVQAILEALGEGRRQVPQRIQQRIRDNQAGAAL